jgi:four helix bundle protein
MQLMRSSIRLHCSSTATSAIRSRGPDSILSNIAEGFEQPTDRSFAKSLYTSKASNAEVSARIRLALKKRYISANDATRILKLSAEVARMTTGLIKYLIQTNRRQRGTGLAVATND